jgi:glutamyl-tRNA synthetase
MKITRFAPSNTGGCHLGSIRTALYNYILAKQSGGKFVLRIEDTDLKRCSDESEKHIYDSLNWLGLLPDASSINSDHLGPYKQSERDYTKYAQYLLDNGFAYYAFDSNDELDSARSRWENLKIKGGYGPLTRHTMKNSLTLPKDSIDEKIKNGDSYVIRFKMPIDRLVRFEDGILGWIVINTNELDDKILMKSGGKVAYHLANVSDDHDMGVTHVLRGNEWVTSTPLHVLLYEAFGWTAPKFYHLPLILDKDGKKFSKRTAIKLGISVFALNWTGLDEDTNEMKTILGFKELGYEKEALLNYIALLGWHPSGNDEVFSVDDLITNFSLDRINTSGAKFDKDKLDFLNSVWVKKISTSEIVELYPELKKYNSNQIESIISLAKERAVFRKDLEVVINIFTKNVNSYNDDTKLDDTFKLVSNTLVNELDSIDWKSDIIKQKIYDVCTNTGVKMGKYLPGLRQALTGGISGPDLNTTMGILGIDETKNRISNALFTSNIQSI